MIWQGLEGFGEAKPSKPPAAEPITMHICEENMAFTTPIHTNEQSVDRVLRAGLPVLLVFWRKDCAPCQQLDPDLNRLAAAYAGKALIAKVDVQDNPALARRYKVTQLPGLVFVKDGQPVERAS